MSHDQFVVLFVATGFLLWTARHTLAGALRNVLHRRCEPLAPYRYPGGDR